MPGERKHKRKETLVLLDVTDLENTRKSARAAVIDISMGGAAFECTDVEFEEESKVELRFKLPGKSVFIVNGIIRRVRERSGAVIHGVEFRDLGFMDKFKLKKVIARISK